MKKFDIPVHYRSSVISELKAKRKLEDPRKQDFSPTEVEIGNIKFLIARHFGFCYGVENAIEIAYKTLNDNHDRRIFLLSEMIHNPFVNEDLNSHGIKFIMDNYGNQFVDWNELTSNDIVIIPAFGTTLEIENILIQKKIDTKTYNTTCPFVEKVWNRAAQIGNENYTIIIHGKAKHEETKATFSHASKNSKAVIIKDIKEAEVLSKIILNDVDKNYFYTFFENKFSHGFDINKDLEKIGVVNQTTMLASETQAIADLLKQTMIKKYGEENLKNHFADTRDTLCYATNDNQSSAIALSNENADFAFVVGGYNSSNTSHLVELLEKSFPTYFISDASKIKSRDEILHFDIHNHAETKSKNYLPNKNNFTIAITSGASCPDSIVDEVINRIVEILN
ncbi:MAG: 4-hydroxy-3-methylbut-2-enyl diphosphate reductase [Stygiobacter sp.]